MARRPFSVRGREAGTVLPIVLAMGMGIGALTAAYSLRQMRETARSQAYENREQAMFEALGQVELVSQIINTSAYDGAGRNLAMLQAIARSDGQFIDRDGWPTGVTAQLFAPPADGLGATYRLTSTAEIGGETRRVMALVRERQSFAEFNVFVESHPLGISGGSSAAFPWVDAPEGALHSNDTIQFYFADKHFRDAVTAVNGFSFIAGAIGPGATDPQNNYFHGPSNANGAPVSGLLDVDVGSFAARPDTMLALTGELDYAHVKLLGNQIHLEHWHVGHYEDQDVSVWTPVSHTETVTTEIPEIVVETQTVEVPRNVYEEQDVWVDELTPTYAWHDETRTRWVWRNVWVAGGGGGDTGGSGTGTDVGYWDRQHVEETYTVSVRETVGWTDTSHWETRWVSTGEVVMEDVEVQVEVATGNMITVTEEVEVIDEWIETVETRSVWIPETRVATHTLGNYGTIFVSGDVVFDPMSAGVDGLATHVLDGQVTIASGGDIYLADSIQYGHRDDDGNLQTAYLNGESHTDAYVPNEAYDGESVLGLIALSDIEYTGYLPDHTEINATLLAKDGHIRVADTRVDGSGASYTTGRGFRKKGLRRLGSLVSNQRPVSTYIDSSNAVTHGFIFSKSVFDRTQQERPPIGFPTVARPVEIARILREIL